MELLHAARNRWTRKIDTPPFIGWIDTHWVSIFARTTATDWPQLNQQKKAKIQTIIGHAQSPPHCSIRCYSGKITTSRREIAMNLCLYSHMWATHVAAQPLSTSGNTPPEHIILVIKLSEQLVAEADNNEIWYDNSLSIGTIKCCDTLTGITY